MKNCEKCDTSHTGSYGSGRFCSSECARSFSTSKNRKAINEKVSKTLKGSGHQDIQKTCIGCNKHFMVSWRRRAKTFCSVRCRNVNNESYIWKIAAASKARCSTLKERKRMRDIGRLGGFGTKGTTPGGTKYQSLLEKKCFEFLENEKINFVAHKPLPDSSKVSDVYLPERDLWIEIDGINREKRKKWLGKNYDYWIAKLQQYEDKKLDLIVCASYDSFVETINNVVIEARQALGS